MLSLLPNKSNLVSDRYQIKMPEEEIFLPLTGCPEKVQSATIELRYFCLRFIHSMTKADDGI